jgi:hypothetical protein
LIEKHPKDADGNLLMFPGAPCADPVAHFRATLAHLADFARLDAGYARWRAGELARDHRQWFAALPAALDAELIRMNVKYPAPFIEPESKVPALAKGRRGLPKQRFFHDTV